jgi:ribosomal protein S18 acetylase RimI-like enzyme
MIKSEFRGQGVGTLLIKGSLQIAKDLGFHAMQFNMVLSQNNGAVRVYQKLGFEIKGIIPKAVRNPDGTFQDGYIMYRNLDDFTDDLGDEQ